MTSLAHQNVERLRDFINIARFGASVDADPADNLAAFQDAIDYCQDNLKTLYIPTQGPSLTYQIGGTLSVTKPLRIIAEGSRNVTLEGIGLGVGEYVLDIDGTTFGTFEQGEFRGFTLIAGDGDCMRVKNASNSLFSDIGLRDGRYGIVYTGTRCFSNKFEKIVHVADLTDVTILMTAHTGGGQHLFDACSLGGGTGFNLSTNTVTDSITFLNTNFEQCTTNSVYIGGTVHGLTFTGCRTEGCDDADFQINPDTGKLVTGLAIHGCAFGASDSADKTRVQLGGAGGNVRGFDISGNTVMHGTHAYAGTFVTLNGDGESGLVTGNFLDGPVAGCAAMTTARGNTAAYDNEGNDGKLPEVRSAPTETVPTDGSGAALVLVTPVARYVKREGRIVGSAFVQFPVTADTTDAKIDLELPTVINNIYARPCANVRITDCADVVQTLLLNNTTGHIQFYKDAFATRTKNSELSGKQMYLEFDYEAA